MIKFQNVSFGYKDSAQKNSLRQISFHVPKGQVVLLCGKSGCGKTTITRLINGLIPYYYDGTLEGEVLVAGKKVSKQPVCETAKLVGSVFQNPRSQFFNVDSTSEIVFGCENMGWPVPDIKKRLEQISHDFDLDNLLERNLFHLSGGEKQKIACAPVTMPDPDVMVLDEPASNLDCRSIQILADIIAVWKNNGKTVIIAEHRLNYLKAVADRVIYMEDGQIVEDVPAKQFWNLPVEVIKQRGLRSIVPVTFERVPPLCHGNGILEVKNFHFSYNGVLDLDIPSLSIPAGAVVGIIGNNGTGKTTFARCLCGLERKATGEISIEGEVLNRKKRLKNSYLVMQDVNHQLFTESVEEEVLIGMPGSEEKNRPEAENILKSMDLLPLKELHPLSLSGGQKQRVAVASALSSRKKILVFDEPTSGLDYHHMIEVAENIRQLSAMGKTLFIITHDPELIAECCNFFIFMEMGRIKWSGGWSADNRQRLRDFFSVIQEM